MKRTQRGRKQHEVSGVAKGSQAELRRIVTAAVRKVCRFPRPGLWFEVTSILVKGHPPESLLVYARLRFLPDGSPFCCGEPTCHLGLLDEHLREISEHVRRAMGLRQSVSVDFAAIVPEYHPGVSFHYGANDPEEFT
jgi:hypothetical protein